MNHKGVMNVESNQLNILEKQGVTVLTFPHFEKTNLIKHCFSSKRGGVSEGIYASLNLGFTRGDKEENVRENYRRICQAVDINEKDLVFSHQVHKTGIRTVTKADLGKGYIRTSDIKETDGLITKETGVPLITFYADCVPLFFLDPVKKAIGTSHAGWRGTVGKIGKKTIDKMTLEYGSNPADILVGIGPSIGLCCFEVGEEVAREFQNAYPDCHEDIIKAGQKDKYMIDLWTANKKSLLEAGVLEKNIIVTDLCTKCHKDFFYSHRGHNGKRGSLAALIELK